MAAVIPDPNRLTRTIPSGPGRGTVGGGTAISATSGGLQAVGEGLGDLAVSLRREEEKDRKDAYTDATVTQQIKLEETLRTFERDTDWESMPDRFNETAVTQLSEIGATIKDEEDRADFMQQGRLRIERAQTAVANKAFTLKRSEMRGRIEGQLESARNLAVSADAASLADMSGSMHDRLMAAADNGYYSREEADQVYRKWQTSVATGIVRMTPPEEREAVLQNPYVQKHLAPETIAELSREAQTATRQREAASIVADVMDSGMDPVERYAQVSDIEDDLLRVETQRQLTQEELRRERVKQAQYAEINERLGTVIMDEGRRVEEFTPDEVEQYNKLPLADRTNLRYMAAPAVKHTDNGVYVEALRLESAEEWGQLKAHVERNRSVITPAHQQRFSGAAVAGAASSNVSMNDMISAAFPDKDKKADLNEMTMQMNEWRDRYVQVYGKEPGDREIQTELNRRLVDPWFDKPVYRRDEEERIEALRDAHLADLLKENKQAFTAAQQYMTSTGQAFDRFEFERTFREAAEMVRVRTIAERGTQDPKAFEAMQATDDWMTRKNVVNPNPALWLEVFGRYYKGGATRAVD